MFLLALGCPGTSARDKKIQAPTKQGFVQMSKDIHLKSVIRNMLGIAEFCEAYSKPLDEAGKLRHPGKEKI